MAPVVAAVSMLMVSCSSELKITSIDPGSGSARGGQKVLIAGTGFDSDCHVSFGNALARSVRVVSSESIEVVSPLSLAGPVDLTITASGGKSVTSPDAYTYLPLQLRFLEAPSHYLPALESSDVRDAVTADFNRDGAPDLFVAVRNAPSLLLLNQGEGSFNAGVSTDAGAPQGGPTDAAASDSLSKEAGADAASQTDGQAKETGTTTDAGTSGGTWVSDVAKVLVFDFDQDGSPDIFLCNRSGDVSRILLNDGHGTLADAPSGTLPLDANDCEGAAVADVNGDGQADLVVLGKGLIGGGKSYVRVYEGSKDAAGWGFKAASALEPAAQVDGKTVGSVHASSANVTGTFAFDQKVTSTGTGAGKVSYDFGTEQGTLAFTIKPPPIAQIPEAVELDIDGDGSGQGLTLQVIDAKGEVFEKALGAINWTGWKHLRAEGVGSWKHSGSNSDGMIDLPIGGIGIQLDGAGTIHKGAVNLDNLRVQLATGGWAVGEDFERADFVIAWNGAMSGLSQADLNGDGLPDLVVSSTDSAAGAFGAVIINHSSQHITQLQLPPGSVLPSLPDPIGATVVLDADGDGDNDIVVISAGQDRLLVNDGKGYFFDNTLAAMPLDDSLGSSAAVADLDLDGRPDLAIANAGAVDRIYVNQGAKGFKDSTPSIPLKSLSTLVLVPLDVDGDGDLDLFVLNQKGTASSLYVSVEPTDKE